MSRFILFVIMLSVLIALPIAGIIALYGTLTGYAPDALFGFSSMLICGATLARIESVNITL